MTHATGGKGTQVTIGDTGHSEINTNITSGTTIPALGFTCVHTNGVLHTPDSRFLGPFFSGLVVNTEP